MALSYKKRKWLSLLVLLVAMPLYIVVAITLVGLIERPPFLLELAIYIGLGIVWIIPLKPIFKGVGQADPDNPVVYDDDHLKKW
jgi:predicted membrane channel-forming protein YqfA (hemolysin III family)